MAEERAFPDRLYDLDDPAETVDIDTQRAESYQDDVLGSG